MTKQKRETRYYLLKDVDSSIEYAQQELERIDFLWGRIRFAQATASPSIKADIRVEVRLDMLRVVRFAILTRQSVAGPPGRVHQRGG